MKIIYYLGALLSYFITLTPAFAEVTCRVNGKLVECPEWLTNNFGLIFTSYFIIWALLTTLLIVTLWKIFTKAGQKGWASIIPFYNAVILFRIVGFSGWWILLMFIPFVNFILYVIVMNSLSKSFGKEMGFTIGLIILPFIFLPILAFGKATYNPILRTKMETGQ